MTHRRRVSGVGVNGNINGNAPNLNHQTNEPNATNVRRRESLQNGTQGGIQFLQRAVEETGDSDTGSSLPDDLDPHGENQDMSERRIRAEAKSMRKVMVPLHLLLLF